MKMNLIPLLPLAVISVLFLKDFADLRIAVIPAVGAIAALAIHRCWFLKLPGPAGLRGAYPVCEHSGKKYSASAISLSTVEDEGSAAMRVRERGAARLDNDLNYERLCRFSEALNSIGAPTAYVYLSVPKVSIAGMPACGPANKSMIIVWASGKDEEEAQSRCAMYSRQLEGVCSVALPNVRVRQMGKEDASLLLSAPLPFAAPRLIPVPERLYTDKRSAAGPIPPPPRSIVPSSSFDPPAAEAIDGDGPLVGWILSNGKKVAPLNLHLRDIQRHTSIFGATGSGKSTTAISLAIRLSSSGVSTLVLDWSGEHSRTVEEAGGKVFCPGSPDRGLTVNPLSGYIGKDLGFQTEFTTDIFAQTFQFTQPQSYMFREALKGCYRSKVSPTLSDLINELNLMPIRSSWDHETRMALIRRLKSFTEGACGLAVNGDDSFSREELFRGLVSIDLSYLKDVNSRTTLCNFLLKLVYDHATARGEPGRLEHVVLIEEAQNIIPPRRPETPLSIGERILGELRKFGEGVIVVSQFPSAISQDVLKNTAIRILHAIRSGEDLRILENSTALSSRQIGDLPLLSPGEAVVNLPYRSSNAFVRIIPDPILAIATPEEPPQDPCPQV